MPTHKRQGSQNNDRPGCRIIRQDSSLRMFAREMLIGMQRGKGGKGHVLHAGKKGIRNRTRTRTRTRTRR